MSWASTLKREWAQRQLADAQWAFLWQPPPEGEWVALDVEATGRDRARDRLLAVAAVRGAGDRVLTSQRLELSLAGRAPVAGQDAAAQERAAMAKLLHFIGPRPLVGYFLEFDLALINRAVQPLLGVALPNPGVEVSALFHDWKFRQLPPYQQQGGVTIDLRFATLLRELGLPERESTAALDGAVLAGLSYIVLQHRMGQRG